eukprot:1101858-Heterocapsa_arctica.AAC.1
MGAALRPANAEELETYSPSIDSERRDSLQLQELASASQFVLPLPVLPEYDKTLAPTVLKPGVYDTD